MGVYGPRDDWASPHFLLVATCQMIENVSYSSLPRRCLQSKELDGRVTSGKPGRVTVRASECDWGRLGALFSCISSDIGLCKVRLHCVCQQRKGQSCLDAETRLEQYQI
ncbi:hypothetical protein RRG08_033106 [Elysia crispata]|uniref:Uncharacterized protein n=1 Tax=Elysia crispata TaxID=231223 RepID=A0AAE1BC16_9GAST|nr:hypothetical protein RRG08_033106 [Elysia crispata]